MITVKQVENQQELEATFNIRKTVFVVEQGVPEEIEYDEYDKYDGTTIHVIAYNDDQPIGCARVVWTQQGAKIGRVAVLKAFRGLGVGEKLCEALIEIIKEKNIPYIYLNGQVSAKGFYEKLGFTTVGEGFYEADILHYKMEKHLENSLRRGNDE